MSACSSFFAPVCPDLGSRSPMSKTWEEASMYPPEVASFLGPFSRQQWPPTGNASRPYQKGTYMEKLERSREGTAPWAVPGGRAFIPAWVKSWRLPDDENDDEK